MALREGVQEAGFVIGNAVVPTAPEDAKPFEGQAAQDRLMFFPSLFLLSVIGFRPCAFGHGLAGPFHEGLTQELGRVPSPVGPDLATAFDLHRSDTGIFLKARGVGIAAAVGAEGGEQSGR